MPADNLRIRARLSNYSYARIRCAHRPIDCFAAADNSSVFTDELSAETLTSD